MYYIYIAARAPSKTIRAITYEGIGDCLGRRRRRIPRGCGRCSKHSARADSLVYIRIYTPKGGGGVRMARLYSGSGWTKTLRATRRENLMCCRLLLLPRARRCYNAALIEWVRERWKIELARHLLLYSKSEMGCERERDRPRFREARMETIKRRIKRPLVLYVRTPHRRALPHIRRVLRVLSSRRQCNISPLASTIIV